MKNFGCPKTIVLLLSYIKKGRLFRDSPFKILAVFNIYKPDFLPFYERHKEQVFHPDICETRPDVHHNTKAWILQNSASDRRF